MLSLGLGSAGVVVGLPALGLAVLADRRARERHDVNWHIAFCPHGELQVHNRGRDTAHRTIIYVQTSEGMELTSGAPRELGPGEEWTTELHETQLRPLGTNFSSHVQVEWETPLGTAQMRCNTAEREAAHIAVGAQPSDRAAPEVRPTSTRERKRRRGRGIFTGKHT